MKMLDSGDVSDHPYQTQFEAFFTALEAGHEMRDREEDDAVDHEEEEPERQHGDGQREDDEDRPHHGVGEAEERGRDERRAEALDMHRGHEIGHREQRERVQQPGDDEPQRFTPRVPRASAARRSLPRSAARPARCRSAPTAP